MSQSVIREVPFSRPRRGFSWAGAKKIDSSPRFEQQCVPLEIQEILSRH